ncbi:MAG TPA: FkbM family methyltransferase, partial [Oligoflexia bacterium]|nr:FkbM family methyltransferase [Oligoflexia bacterium]
ITHFRWYLFKTKETEVRHFIDTYLKPNETLFDVGANIGVFSVYAAKRGLRVFSFEPEYSNLALLKKNILRNRVHANIQTYCVGISDFVGLSKLHLQSTLGGAAAHTESTSAIQSTSEGFAVVFSEGIVTATLDYLCENLGVVPNGLKIDTDGNEPKILSGAPKLLKNPVLKSIIIEIPSDPDKKRFCEDILIQNGFHCDWSAQSSKNQIWVRIKNI